MMGLITKTLDRERQARLESASSLRDLIDLGVERGFTLWPEWGLAFTDLDKRIENRPNPPPAGLIGKRMAFHNGAHVGGRKGDKAHQEGLYALTATAKSAGWEIRLMHQAGGGAWVEFHKSGKVVRLDTRWDPLGTRKAATPGAVGIVRSAITFTAVISGFEPPTETPFHEWQHASDPQDSEDWSYGWHVTDVIALRTPIPCSGLQGPWTLAGAIEREAKRKATR